MRSTVLLMFACATCVVAQTKPTAADQFRREFLLPFEDAQYKAVHLAEAIPVEKYGWRPGPGVRSISEVFVHIAGGNQLLLKLVNGTTNTTMTEDFKKTIQSNADREKTVAEKAAVIALMKRSFDEVREALARTTDADLNRDVDFFGRKTTVRGVFLIIGNHASEHMGQSIAYARMNGIVPPWSR